MRDSSPPLTPLPTGQVVDLGQAMTLGPPRPISIGGFCRVGRSGDALFRVLELPGVEPPSVTAALAVPGVASPSARRRDDGRTLLALRPAPGPSLEWLLRRGEGLPLWDLALIESLAGLFQAVHDAGLRFHEIATSMFSVASDGSVQLEAPEALAGATEAVRSESVWAAPELATGEGSGPLADQFSLGLLVWALVTGRTPPSRGVLPLARIFRPETPHGLFGSIQRATRRDPAERHPSCRAFAADLRSRTVPRGASPSGFAIGAATEIGRLKSQQMPVNQDAWFTGYDPATRRGLLLVADGVSTADVGSGDLAAGFVREAVRGAWEGEVGDIFRGYQGPMPHDWARAALEAILEDANARVYAFLKRPIFVGALGPGVHPPGSTAVLALLDGDRLTFANIGDSRMYLLRDGLLEQMTVDQDVRTDLLRAGRDPRSVANASSLGALTHTVGNFFFDSDGGIIRRRLDPEVRVLHLRAGDRLLLCSDGVPDCLGDGYEQVVAAELGADARPEESARRLCRLADEALGADNITALILRAE